MESKDIYLGKAKPEDLPALYRNVWSRAETAKYMAWRVSKTEEDAAERMHKTIEYQKSHDAFSVYLKETGEAIGYAGVEETAPGVFGETGIALAPEYTGKGFGKQVLTLLLEFCAEKGGKEFLYSCRSGNAAAKGLARSMGFEYVRSEERTDPRSGKLYSLEYYIKKIQRG